MTIAPKKGENTVKKNKYYVYRFSGNWADEVDVFDVAFLDEETHNEIQKAQKLTEQILKEGRAREFREFIYFSIFIGTNQEIEDLTMNDYVFLGEEELSDREVSLFEKYSPFGIEGQYSIAFIEAASRLMKLGI